MVSGRPLLYLSLPGVALILGVFWYRRRNKNHFNDSDKEDEIDHKVQQQSHKDQQREQTESQFETKLIETQSNTTQNHQPSKSMNIKSNTHDEDESNAATKLFGKSAPIKIVQNGSRSSPVKVTNASQNIDSEVLRMKIEDAEHKTLRSIDEDFENLSSPVDLPDSVNHRISFYGRSVNCSKDQPVVIKATTTPKISPENSFLESKYTSTGNEQNNNNCSFFNSSALEFKPKKNDSKLESIDKSQQHQSESKATADSQNTSTTTTTTTTTTDANGNEKRIVETASPSLSLCSVQSGDSGKGSSLPRSEATRAKTTYEFLYPISLVGYLYGRQRSFLNKIKTKTNAEVTLRRYPHSSKLRICVIEGTETEINAALEMIRQRLPAKRYPNFTMQRIHYALPQTIVPLSTQSLLNLQLNLIEGINNDVVVSTVISGNHLFVQHPLHPTHPSLAVLQKCLYDSYTNAEAPLLPGLEISAVCVIAINSVWYRVQIVEHDPEDDQRCIVKFLDFGGYMNVHFKELRQIRSDFMGLPFQATECILSNIEPIDYTWSAEVVDVLSKLTRGIVMQAQIAGYNSHNIPEIYLFACLGPNNVIFINKELVARNLAKWVEVRE